MATGAIAAKSDVIIASPLYRSVNRPAPPPPHATTSPLPSPRAPMSLAINRLPMLLLLLLLLPCALTCPLLCSAATHNPSPSPPPEATTALAPPALSKKAPPSSIDPRHPPPPVKSASPETRRRVAAFQPLLLLLLLLPLISMSHRPSLDHCSPKDDGSAPRHGRPSFRSKLLPPPPPASATKSTYVPLRTAARACQHLQHKDTHAYKHYHHTQHLQTRCLLKSLLFHSVGPIFARIENHEQRSHLLNSHSQTRQDQGRS